MFTPTLKLPKVPCRATAEGNRARYIFDISQVFALLRRWNFHDQCVTIGCNEREREREGGREGEREREGGREEGKKMDRREKMDQREKSGRKREKQRTRRKEKKDRTIFLDDDVRAVEHLVQRYERGRSIIASITNSKGRFGPDWSRMRNEI